MNQVAQSGGSGTITIGVHTFIVDPPTDKDLGTLLKFLKSRIKSPLQRVVDDPGFKQLTGPDRRAAIRAATAATASQSGMDRGGATEALQTVEGCRFLAWLVCRKNSPDLTIEALAVLITEENYLSVFVDLDEATGMGQLGNSAGRPGSTKGG